MRLLKPVFREIAGFIFVDKISGVNTHASDFGRAGIVDVIEESFGSKLFVVHRLDKGTSGALMFAKSSEDAKDVAALFESHKVAKRYLFLTDKKVSLSEFKISSYIEKDKNVFVSHHKKDANAHTRIVKIKSLPLGDLWEALPTTGKPHQIRLHALEAGIPILGDSEHGGSPFTRLCLHSLSLKFQLRGEEVFFETAYPAWAAPVESLQELTLMEAIAQRERMYGISKHPDECLRLSHTEVDTYRVDQFGDHLWVYWYKESDPLAQDLARFENIGKAHNKKVFVRKMLNRGDDPNSNPLWKLGNTQERWEASENGVKYGLRTDTGLSPGLFLDQRENRIWARKHAQDRSVLNLFSYTSGFSVNAALGGAREVVTVDVSANFLEWSKENFKLNGLDPEKYEFWVSDALVFLKGTFRRKRKFDMIICDPPSFGRSKNGVFSINKNYEELLTNCLYSLTKNGLLLFSTNYEKWTMNDIHKNMNKLKSNFSFKILEAPRQGLDYELPDQEPLMKSIILRKT